MRFVFYEFRVAVVLFVIAAVTPLLWVSYDSALRLARKQHAHALCASTHRDLNGCSHLHPGKLHPFAYEYCRKLHYHSDCAEWNPRKSR